MKIVMTLTVRDEADILEDNLLFHLNQGVDLVIATDNRSVDGSREILERYERDGCLRVISEPGNDHAQGRWVTRMARLAYAEYGADWIIHADADEFWWPNIGTIRSTLLSTPRSIEMLRIPRVNFVPRPADDRPLLERMNVRETLSFDHPHGPLLPKVCHRGVPDVVVADGNHDVVTPPLVSLDSSDPMTIFHFPIRSWAQFERKIAHGGAALARNKELEPHTGAGWRDLYRRLEAGELVEYFKSRLIDEDAVSRGTRAGDLVVDERLIRFLTIVRRGGTPVPAATPQPRLTNVGVVVVTHSRGDLAQQCVEAVAREVEPKSVVVVVNRPDLVGESDVGVLAAGPAEVVLNQQALGYGANLNRGVAHLADADHYDYYLLLNDDAIPRFGSISALVRSATSTSRVGITGPRIVDRDGNLQSSCFRFPTVFSEVVSAAMLPNVVQSRLRNRFVLARGSEADWLLGAALLVRSSAFHEVGGFDERFFMYSEETDFALRLRRRGWGSTLCPEAVVCHAGASSTEDGSASNHARLVGTSRWLYIRKHWSFAGRLALLGSLAIVYCWNTVYVAARVALSPRTFRMKLALWRAHWRGRPLPDLPRRSAVVS